MINNNDWNLILVNKLHPLPGNYAFEIKKLPCGAPVDERIYDSLTKMLADGEAAGLKFEVRTAYRTLEEQSALFENHVKLYMERDNLSREEAVEVVKKIIADPGRSEHNAGLAVDIVSTGHPDLLDNSFEDTPEGKWLHANCHRYGFILRYPKGKEGITHISYESWHFRYVGEKAATEIMSRGICLEEYLGIVD
jgi:D-alanyl-D-alanine carboxypeptidase